MVFRIITINCSSAITTPHVSKVSAEREYTRVRYQNQIVYFDSKTIYEIVSRLTSSAIRTPYVSKVSAEREYTRVPYQNQIVYFDAEPIYEIVSPLTSSAIRTPYFRNFEFLLRENPTECVTKTNRVYIRLILMPNYL